MTIVSFVMVGLTAFMLDVGRGMFWATQKASISQDVRHFTMQLASEARSANSAVIYRSFSPSHRANGNDRRDDRESGDCLVLINTTPWPNADDPEVITRIIVYFRRSEEGGIGPVHKVVKEFQPSSYISLTGTTLEQALLNIAPSDTGDYPTVVELSRGLANGRLFTNFRQGRVIIVNGEIIHGNTVKEVTNTYNLSVSPRG